jgi:hypothetical protein
MNNLAIDDTQTRAICDEIGERLRVLLKSTASDERRDFDEKIHRPSYELAERKQLHER